VTAAAARYGRLVTQRRHALREADWSTARARSDASPPRPAPWGASRPLAATVLSLQRRAGNRSVASLLRGPPAGRGPASRRLARDVESDQLAAEATAQASLKDAAVAAKARAGKERAAMGRQLIADFVKVFAEETVTKVERCEYDAATVGVALAVARGASLSVCRR
jgi:hypothetical protein